MKFFSDKELKHELEVIDLGTVMIGEKSEYNIYVLNEDAGNAIQLEFSTSNDEVFITDFPKELKRQS